MKGRIGKYKDKIVVWGDPNLTDKNEINIDSLGEGGEQSNIPVEYYKVVALEGENLDDAIFEVVIYIDQVIEVFPYFCVLVKGASSSSEARLYTGIYFDRSMVFEGNKSYAYAVIPLGVSAKKINADGELYEPPIFNNIFDALESIGGPAVEELSYLKKHLVPITAEEFYNLDDLK